MKTLFAALIASLFGGCASGPEARPEAVPGGQRGAAAVIEAGFAKVDITPPLFLGMFGHGPESRVATGVRYRLQCRVMALRAKDSGGAVLDQHVLAVCDLGQPALNVQRAIVARFRGKTGIDVIHENRFTLVATHTHQSFGHYFAAGNLTGPFSSYLVGYDAHVEAMLVDRVAAGAMLAWADLSPVEVSVAMEKGAWGLARNRSLSAFERNPTSDQVPDWVAASLPEEPAFRAVDPRIPTLVLKQTKAGGKHAMLTVLNWHSTVMDAYESLYGGDVFGVTRRLLERSVAHGPGCGEAVDPNVPVRGDFDWVAVLPGAEGDQTANVMTRGPAAVMRYATRAAEKIRDIATDTTRLVHLVNPDFSVRYAELDFKRAALSSGQRLSDRPELGSGSAGGASDHPTTLRIFPQLNPGVHSLALREEQSPKHALMALNGPFTAGVELPRWAPVSQIRLGNWMLAFLPAEPTVVAARRIRRAIQAAGGPPSENVMLVGLAGEYMQYVTTPEEYVLQLYEGASTLYGFNTAAFLAEQHACLVHDVAPGGECQARETVQRFELAPDNVAAILAGPVTKSGPELAEITSQSTCERARVGEFPSVEWQLRAGVPDGVSNGDRFTIRVLRLEPSGPPTEVAIDDGFDISLEAVRGTQGKKWFVRWSPDPATLVAGREYKFEVCSRRGRDIVDSFESPKFPAPSAQAVPAGCKR